MLARRWYRKTRCATANSITASVTGAVLRAVNLPGGKTLCVLPGAYVLVGATELVGEKSLVGPARNWEALPGWKKGLISTLVISEGSTESLVWLGRRCHAVFILQAPAAAFSVLEALGQCCGC